MIMQPDLATYEASPIYRFRDLSAFFEKTTVDSLIDEQALQQFAKKQQSQLKKRTAIKLREKLKRNHLTVCFEPVSSPLTQRLSGANVTLKIPRQGIGLVPAQHLFSIVETSNILIDIGCWLVKEVLYLSREFPPHFTFTIPVNFYQLQNHKFVSYVCNIIDQLKVNKGRLQFTLSGDIIQQYGDHLDFSLQPLIEAGVTFSAGQFGRIDMPLQSLTQKGFSTLVLDYCLVIGSEQNRGKQQILKMLVNEAHAYNCKLKAPGIDTVVNEELYSQIGVDELQKPIISLDDLKMLSAKTLHN